MIELFDQHGRKLASGTIVPDGGKIRVPAHMMDGAPDVAAITRAAIADDRDLADIQDIMHLADSQPTITRHRPGSAALTDADRDARQKALDARDKRLVDAWKAPAAVNASQIHQTAPTTPAGDPAARRDARLRDAWKGAR